MHCNRHLHSSTRAGSLPAGRSLSTLGASILRRVAIRTGKAIEIHDAAVFRGETCLESEHDGSTPQDAVLEHCTGLCWKNLSFDVIAPTVITSTTSRHRNHHHHQQYRQRTRARTRSSNTGGRERDLFGESHRVDHCLGCVCHTNGVAVALRNTTILGSTHEIVGPRVYSQKAVTDWCPVR